SSVEHDPVYGRSTTVNAQTQGGSLVACTPMCRAYPRCSVVAVTGTTILRSRLRAWCHTGPGASAANRAACLLTGATMTEQSQMPLVGRPKRRGWREIVWFRPLTSSTHATLVVTRRGRLRGILPADSPRVLSDYLAWPYDFREVDTRERLLALEQRLESSD